jgi:hypothetical protein
MHVGPIQESSFKDVMNLGIIDGLQYIHRMSVFMNGLRESQAEFALPLLTQMHALENIFAEVGEFLMINETKIKMQYVSVQGLAYDPKTLEIGDIRRTTPNEALEEKTPDQWCENKLGEFKEMGAKSPYAKFDDEVKNHKIGGLCWIEMSQFYAAKVDDDDEYSEFRKTQPIEITTKPDINYDQALTTLLGNCVRDFEKSGVDDALIKLIEHPSFKGDPPSIPAHPLYASGVQLSSGFHRPFEDLLGKYNQMLGIFIKGEDKQSIKRYMEWITLVRKENLKVEDPEEYALMHANYEAFDIEVLKGQYPKATKYLTDFKRVADGMENLTSVVIERDDPKWQEQIDKDYPSEFFRPGVTPSIRLDLLVAHSFLKPENAMSFKDVVDEAEQRILAIGADAEELVVAKDDLMARFAVVQAVGTGADGAFAEVDGRGDDETKGAAASAAAEEHRDPAQAMKTEMELRTTFPPEFSNPRAGTRFRLDLLVAHRFNNPSNTTPFEQVVNEAQQRMIVYGTGREEDINKEAIRLKDRYEEYKAAFGGYEDNVMKVALVRHQLSGENFRKKTSLQKGGEKEKRRKRNIRVEYLKKIKDVFPGERRDFIKVAGEAYNSCLAEQQNFIGHMKAQLGVLSEVSSEVGLARIIQKLKEDITYAEAEKENLIQEHRLVSEKYDHYLKDFGKKTINKKYRSFMTAGTTLKGRADSYMGYKLDEHIKQNRSFGELEGGVRSIATHFRKKFTGRHWSGGAVAAGDGDESEGYTLGGESSSEGGGGGAGEEDDPSPESLRAKLAGGGAASAAARVGFSLSQADLEAAQAKLKKLEARGGAAGAEGAAPASKLSDLERAFAKRRKKQEASSGLVKRSSSTTSLPGGSPTSPGRKSSGGG